MRGGGTVLNYWVVPAPTHRGSVGMAFFRKWCLTVKTIYILYGLFHASRHCGIKAFFCSLIDFQNIFFNRLGSTVVECLLYVSGAKGSNPNTVRHNRFLGHWDIKTLSEKYSAFGIHVRLKITKKK